MSRSSGLSVIQGLAYPERPTPRAGKFDRWAESAVAPVVRRIRASVVRREQWIQQVAADGPECARLADEDLRHRARDLRVPLTRQGFRSALVAKTFALVREAASRT